MAQLFVGTSGWAYPSWKPAFYPEKLAQTKFLTYYASQLNTVEVNLTFRQLLTHTIARCVSRRLKNGSHPTSRPLTLLTTAIASRNIPMRSAPACSGACTSVWQPDEMYSLTSSTKKHRKERFMRWMC